MKQYLKSIYCSWLLLFFLVTTVVANVDSDDKLYVNLVNGTALSYEIDLVHKLVFTENEVTIHRVSGNKESFFFAEFRHLTFVPYISGGSSDNEIVSDNGSLINVYPNPVTDELQIIGYTLQNTETIKIFDISGKIVMFSHANIINVSTLAKGVYFVQVANVGNIKFIKQ